MSTLYEENFWKGYDIIHEHYIKRRNQFNQLNYVLSRLSVLYDNFGQSLKEIIADVTINQDKEPNEDSFDNFFVEYYKKLSQQAEYYIKLGDTINKEYVEKPLGLEYQEINFTDNLLEMENNTKDIRDEYFLHIENNYLSELETLENKKQSFFKSMEKSVKNILEKRAKKKEFVPDESTKEYLVQLLLAERKRKEYVGKYRMMLRHYYNTEKKFMEQTKLKMEKCANLINDLSTNLHSLYLDNKYIDDINVEENLQNFVNKNRTLGFPPFQLDFINYTIDYNTISKDITIKEQDKPQKMENVKDYLLSASKVISSQLNNNYKEIEQYFNSLFNGTFEEQQKEELLRLFSDKTTDTEQRNSNTNNEVVESKAGLYKTVGIKNQIAFLSLLNNQRTNSYAISETNFNTLAEIVKFIMNDIKQAELEIYYKIIGWCIILSQTFKCTIKGEEIYIQKSIENNEIFSDKNFWISLCRFYVADNFYKGKSFVNFSTSLSEEDVRKIKSIANSKSLTIIHNLFSFHVKIEIIDEIIDSLCTTYDIDKEYLESIKASMMGKENKQ